MISGYFYRIFNFTFLFHQDLDAPHPDSWMLPKPPPYTESISTQPSYTSIVDPVPNSTQSEGQLYNIASDSSQTDPWRQRIQNLSSDSSELCYAVQQNARPTIHSHSTSYSSESSFENSNSPRPARYSDINPADHQENNIDERQCHEHTENGDSDLHPYPQVDELPVRNIILPHASSVIHDDGRERQVQVGAAIPHVRKDHDSRMPDNNRNKHKDRNSSGDREKYPSGRKEEPKILCQGKRKATADSASDASKATQTKHKHGGKDHGHRRGHPHTKQNLHGRSHHHASTPALSSQHESATSSGRSNSLGKFRSVDNIQNPGSNARHYSPERTERHHRNRKMNKKEKDISRSLENIPGASLSLRPDPTLDNAVHQGSRGYLGHGDIGTAPQTRQSWSPRDGAALSPAKSSNQGSKEALFKQNNFDQRFLGCVNDAFSVFIRS